MKHLGLFEGIGGFSLAANWMDWSTSAWVEIDKNCQRVLKDKFRQSKGYEDIKKFSGYAYRGAIDIVTGGFPCQTFSLAGKGAVDLSLWKEMFRVIREVKPSWVVAENVYGILARKNGMALETVCYDLESKGYKVFPPLIIPACGKGAPHRRDRIWIIAHSVSNGYKLQHRKSRCQALKIKIKENKWQWVWAVTGRVVNAWAASHADTRGLQVGFQSGEYCIQRSIKPFQGSEFTRTYPKSNWSEFPTQSPIYTRNDGLSAELVRCHARLRKNAIKGSGNAISPQIAFEIFKAIQLYDTSKINGQS